MMKTKSYHIILNDSESVLFNTHGLSSKICSQKSCLKKNGLYFWTFYLPLMIILNYFTYLQHPIYFSNKNLEMIWYESRRLRIFITSFIEKVHSMWEILWTLLSNSLIEIKDVFMKISLCQNFIIQSIQSIHLHILIHLKVKRSQILSKNWLKRKSMLMFWKELKGQLWMNMQKQSIISIT